MRRAGYILLVEDNPDDIELTKRAMSANNIANKTIVAKDGQEALDFLLEKGELEGKIMEKYPTVVLLDIKMPKVDGLEVLKKLRSDQRTRVLPIVILTGSSEERDVIESYNLGANSYIRKPVGFNQFVEAIKELGLYWLILNEPVPNSGA